MFERSMHTPVQGLIPASGGRPAEVDRIMEDEENETTLLKWEKDPASGGDQTPASGKKWYINDGRCGYRCRFSLIGASTATARASRRSQPLAGADAASDAHGVDLLAPDWIAWRGRCVPPSQSLTRTNKPRPDNKEDQQARQSCVPRSQSLTRTSKFANWHAEPRVVVRAHAG